MDQTHTPADNPKLDALLAGYLEAVERGEKPDRAQLIAANPDLATELQAFFTDLDRVQRVAADPAHASTVIRPDTDPSPGVIIAGRYKLLENIGEGGMGSVWVAEQLRPVKRRVAIKLIKAGMDSKQVLARFEAERQALAVMDHPNIAKVFDGGLTEQGRPYFVMEYVKGVPFTDYCDRARLPLKDRLSLFVQVCSAVQHAHQKGIIHRDLKPSNILICLYDGHPVPKVIDFGLAKAMHQPLTEQSIYTGHGVMVGTPLYMSPEQAELNNLDIDTRTDIYSLGVVLYELLTGSTPLERNQLQKAAFEEMLRLIKEVEPPRPSLRLSGSDSLPSIAAQRSIDPKHLSRSLAGDLDWIVMKTLDKERSRRYETANALARDIERFLNEEPVEACPPSPMYRLKKYVKRHKAHVIAASAVMVSLILGVIGTSWGLFQAERAKERTNQVLGQVTKERDAKETERQKATMAQSDAETAQKAESVQRENAEHQLLEGILRPIGSSDPPDEAELRAIADWSTIADSRLKVMGLTLALEDPETAMRIARRADRVIQASIGISPERRSHAIKLTTTKQRDMSSDPRIRFAACRLAMELESTELPALSESITFARTILRDSPAMFYDFVHASDSRLSHEQMAQFVACIDTMVSLLDTDMYHDSADSVLKGLPIIASHMSLKQVNSLVEHLLADIGKNSPTARRGNARVALTAIAILRLSPFISDEVLEKAMLAVLSPDLPINEALWHQFWRDVQLVLKTESKRLTLAPADILLTELIRDLDSEMQPYVLSAINDFVPRLDAHRNRILLDVCLRAITHLHQSSDFAANLVRLPPCWECMAKVLEVVPREELPINPEEVISLAVRDIAYWREWKYGGGDATSVMQCVQKFGDHLDSADAKRIWGGLIADTRSSDLSHIGTVYQTGPLLGLIATRLTPEEQVSQWDSLAAAYKTLDAKGLGGSPNIIEYGLHALVKHLSDEKVAAEMRVILPELNQSVDTVGLSAADRTLAVLNTRVHPRDALSAWKAYAKMLGSNEFKCEGVGLAKLGERMSEFDRSVAAEEMICVLENDGNESMISRAEVALESIASAMSVPHANRCRAATVPRIKRITSSDVAIARIRLLAGISKQLSESEREMVVVAVEAVAEHDEKSSIVLCIAERPCMEEFISGLSPTQQFRIAEVCVTHGSDFDLTRFSDLPLRLMERAVRDQVSGLLLQRHLDRVMCESGGECYGISLASYEAEHLRLCCAGLSSPEAVARIFAHPACFGVLREVLLLRFEELVCHQGNPVFLKSMTFSEEDGGRFSIDDPGKLLSRRFRKLHEASAWIEQNCSGVDLEATPSIARTRRGGK